MEEKKKVPHLDLTLSTTEQPGATQLIKKAVKTGQAVNVLAIVKQFIISIHAPAKGAT